MLYFRSVRTKPEVLGSRSQISSLFLPLSRGLFGRVTVSRLLVAIKSEFMPLTSSLNTNPAPTEKQRQKSLTEIDVRWGRNTRSKLIFEHQSILCNTCLAVAWLFHWSTWSGLPVQLTVAIRILGDECFVLLLLPLRDRKKRQMSGLIAQKRL
jgi:hypothetical protein